MEDELDRGGVEPVIEATEDDPAYLLFYDGRLNDEPHVHMPDPDADDPYAHWPDDRRPGTATESATLP